MRKGKILIFTILAFCACLVVLLGIIRLERKVQETETENETVVYDYPPMIYVNDILYQRQKKVSEEKLTEEYTYIGDIESTVPSSEAPRENFQANDDIIGAELYQYQNSIIVVFNQNYELYCSDNI